eukprot:7545276-Lingulodinium_polyedra.AAC.1
MARKGRVVGLRGSDTAALELRRLRGLVPRRRCLLAEFEVPLQARDRPGACRVGNAGPNGRILRALRL